MDRSDLLDRVLALLSTQNIAFCLIGGQAVNAYVEPVVSLDLDIAIAAPDAERLERALAPPLHIERFVHSLNVSGPESDLRVQFQLDPRYAPFIGRAASRSVLGIDLPVARVEDVLQGKVWAASDTTRRPSKRQKDLADISRLVEGFPHLREQVPGALLDRLL